MDDDLARYRGFNATALRFAYLGGVNGIDGRKHGPNGAVEDWDAWLDRAFPHSSETPTKIVEPTPLSRAARA